MRISDWSSDVCSSDLEHNIEFSAKYSDNPGGDFAINPYAKLFWAVESKSSTVVLGKAGGTFDIELGAVPTVKAGAITLSAPTWITVGPKTYWGTGVNKDGRSEEHTSELQSLMRNSYAVFCLKKKNTQSNHYQSKLLT